MVDLSILDKSFCELPSGFIERERREREMEMLQMSVPFIYPLQKLDLLIDLWPIHLD